MILDHISQWRQYTGLSPRFQAAFGYLEKFDGKTAPGRYELDGSNVYALVQKYATKSTENRLYEAHEKYLDVQYVHAGRETIYWAPLTALGKPSKAYDDKNDAALYPLIPGGFPVHLGAGDFTVLFPGDGHVPCCIWDSASDIVKVVVKVRV